MQYAAFSVLAANSGSSILAFANVAQMTETVYPLHNSIMGCEVVLSGRLY
jgi:hypothetical protein